MVFSIFLPVSMWLIFTLTSGLGASQLVSGFLEKGICPLTVAKLVCSLILCRIVRRKVGKKCNVVEARKMAFQQRKYFLLMMK